MGACVCTQKDPKSLLSSVRQRLALAIDTHRLSTVAHLMRKYCVGTAESPAVLNVNDWIVVLQGVPLNALGYAFRAGNAEIVQYLVEVAKANVGTLYDTYKRFYRTPVDVACEYGYLSLLQYFIPIHLAETEKQAQLQSLPMMFDESQEELSIFSSEPNILATSLTQELRPPTPYQPAIQRACERGHIAIVEWLQNYFSERTPPSDFDVNTVDEKAGENCALVAARQGNLKMIKYLHTMTKANFHAKNRRNESAIQVTASGSKRKDARNYLECLRYLVEVVQVDVKYQCEETLLICEDRELIRYLEEQLQAQGVAISKARVDSEFAIIRGRDAHPLSQHSAELEQKFRNVGAKFQIRDFVDDSQDKSYVSSIPPRSVLDASDLDADLCRVIKPE